MSLKKIALSEAVAQIQSDRGGILYAFSQGDLKSILLSKRANIYYKGIAFALGALPDGPSIAGQ